MALISRRTVVAAGATLPVALSARNSRAASGLPDLAEVLTPVVPPVPPPPGVFLDASGKEHTVAEFRGHGMVINFWATWCAPCVAEMPSLAALSVALAPHDIAVLPLSSDRGGAPVVEPWLRDKGLTSLPVLLDPKGAMARGWKVRGLPTTVIIDRAGRDCARLEGVANWASPSAIALIRKLVDA